MKREKGAKGESGGMRPIFILVLGRYKLVTVCMCIVFRRVRCGFHARQRIHSVR